VNSETASCSSIRELWLIAIDPNGFYRDSIAATTVSDGGIDEFVSATGVQI
jgi:hypothetical protein